MSSGSGTDAARTAAETLLQAQGVR
jgi:hypothetical protein